MKNNQKIGELLLDLNVLTKEGLERALEEQKRTGDRLGAILIRMNLISEEDLDYLLGRQLNIPSINLENYSPTSELLATIPEKIIKKYLVFPISLKDKTLTVATANPKDLTILDDLVYVTGYKIVPVVTSISSLRRKIQDLFEKPADWEKMLKVKEAGDLEIINSDRGVKEEDLEMALQSAEETLVVRLVNAIILAALEKEASHVHIEPKENSFEVYMRM